MSRAWKFGLPLVASMWLVTAAAPAGNVVARGARLASVLGCTDCHGPSLEGKRLFASEEGATLWSTNLSRAVPRLDDAALERVLRTGVRPDGSKLWYMDVVPYVALSPAELAALIAWLRTVPPAGEDRPGIRMGPRFRKAVEAGLARPAADTLAADQARAPAMLGRRYAEGRHLALIACSGCHDPSLRGSDDSQPGDPPDLAAAAAYDPAAFRRLVREGTGLSGGAVGEMSEAARQRLRHLTDAEITAIRAYLVAWSVRRTPAAR